MQLQWQIISPSDTPVIAHAPRSEFHNLIGNMDKESMKWDPLLKLSLSDLIPDIFKDKDKDKEAVNGDQQVENDLTTETTDATDQSLMLSTSIEIQGR